MFRALIKCEYSGAYYVCSFVWPEIVLNNIFGQLIMHMHLNQDKTVMNSSENENLFHIKYMILME